MDFSNINQSSQIDSSTYNSFVTETADSDASTSAQSNIKTTFRPPLNNEFSEEQDVEYKPSQDIVQEKTQIISKQEEQRLQKLQQKEILINLQKASQNQGSSYSRNMDEAMVMNRKNKDLLINPDDSNDNYQTKKTDVLKESLYINPTSEELFEEFLHPQKKGTSSSPESALKNFENNRKQHENNKNKKSILYEFEEDEAINMDLLKFNKENNNISSDSFQKEAIQNTNQNVNTQQKNINPALQRALKKNDQRNNVSKLKKKFNKK